MKTEFIKAIEEEPASMSEICREFGISRKTGYKWKKRYLEEGAQGLKNQSTRPKSSIVISEDVIYEVVKIRASHATWGARKIRHYLINTDILPSPLPSISSINRILKSCGLLRPTSRTKRFKMPVKRLDEREDVLFANDEWTMDFKGWWIGRDGVTRCTPLTIRDSLSKFIICIKLTNGSTAQAVKEAMEECFEKYGLPRTIYTDNGTPFASANALLGLTKLSAWWIRLGIKPSRSRPGCPQDNGAHERMHKDMMKELEIQNADTQEEMDAWKDEYNNIRPHESLGGDTPSMHYEKSTRKYTKRLKACKYKGMTVRTICLAGKLSYMGVEYFISQTLTKQKIGIKKQDNELVELYFCEHLLGKIDTKHRLFIPVQVIKKGEVAKVFAGILRK